MFALAVVLLTAINAVKATVPFTYHDNRMMIECKIDGKGPFHMVVDTGAPDVTVTPEVIKALNVNERTAGTVTGAGNKSVRIGESKLATLAVGSLSFSDVDASVIDLTEIRTKFHFQHLDGIIGYPILERYATFVNVDAGTLSFSKTPVALPASATRTSFSGVLPIIHAKIQGIATTVLVDTGDRSSLTLFGPFARRHSFYGRYPSKKNAVTGYGIGGPIYADVFRLPSLDVLGIHLRNVVTRASRQTGGAFASSNDGGSIGTGVLKRFNVVYDYPRRAIIAWPSKYFATPDVFTPPGSVRKQPSE